MFGDALNTLARRRDDGSLPGVYGDVRFPDLMADPVAAIAGAYAGIGREMTGEHRAAVVRYLDDKPRGKHGTHRYTAADWGFDADVVRGRPGALHGPLRRRRRGRVAARPRLSGLVRAARRPSPSGARAPRSATAAPGWELCERQPRAPLDVPDERGAELGVVGQARRRRPRGSSARRTGTAARR